MAKREGSRFDGLMSAAKSKHSDAQTSEHSDIQTPEHSNVETPERSDIQPAKGKDPNYQRTTVYLPKALHRRLRAAAIAEGREMSDIITTLVEDWLNEKP